MTGEILLLALFALGMSLAPYWFVSTGARRYLLWDIGGWGALALLGATAPAIGISLAPPLVTALVMAIKLALFFVFLVERDEEGEIRWSADAAALFTLGLLLLAGTQALAWPIDGDEPYYVLVAESLLRDGDLDLRNQYAAPERSIAGRRDLEPQSGDPRGSGGEAYSRHEPFLSVLLIPGIGIAGLWGAMATLALLGALATRSILLLLVEGGFERRILLRVWPLLALGPPLLFYSMRVWPEVPAALCLSEAMRNGGKRRTGVMLAWLAALSLLQLRFLIIAVVFGAVVLFRSRPSRNVIVALVAIALLTLGVAWLASGSPLVTHQLSELRPAAPWKYVRGFFALLLDAQTGMLLQAPLWLAGVLGLLGWRSLPESTRWGAIAAVPYLILLLPRDEWHGGWSPPLRYLVVFAPVIAAGAAAALRWSRGWLVPVAIWTAAIAVHGLAHPWRLFHIASGESVLGEWLSIRFGTDFSRMLPSFIRPNAAAWAASILLIALVGGGLLLLALNRRRETDGHPERGGAGGREAKDLKMQSPHSGRNSLVALLLSLAMTLLFLGGLRPGRVVHFEDTHVEREGGRLHPEEYAVARFLYRGGWMVGEGDALRFRMKPGNAVIHAATEGGAAIDVNGRRVVIPASADFVAVRSPVTREDVELRIVRGTLILDRIEHE